MKKMVQASYLIRQTFKNTYDKYLLKGDNFYCPLCDTGYKLFLSAGVIPRKNARCPGCNSLERHRLLWLVLETLWESKQIAKGGFLLHVAPEFSLAKKLKKSYEYLSVDLDGNLAMQSMDITDINLPDETFDAIIANHVMEHIVNDFKALQELYRVLKPGGWASIQVPLRGEITQEDFSITDPKQREKLYGQSDHVRQYGYDFKERLTNVGFKVLVFKKESFDSKTIEKISVECENEVWICRKLEASH
ncbi:class I SAM-dependent methyltransferase [Oscillatoria acuminata]|uniref:Methylase involved in ubiquinone/menaquinone biosynthesis n=1 Tax=Oscillatoria acuminata PCC 6304 TaxID=56110 RepID=K9TIC7_9CYAN|nr:class I SAM-dependent methyltransferase [Oscillatoria acuminata]AFY82280.1 methylase involved in ubiquinone/menaquinone biosynthesis [Oscillatoria acuminata PCC 6304]